MYKSLNLPNAQIKKPKMFLSAFIGVHRRLQSLLFIAITLVFSSIAQAQFPNIGRTATPNEIAAWDIDVRPDFKGLPKGAGTATKGQQVWEAKCESCHGTFGESNEVFTPIAGGTTKRDMEVGRVANLIRTDYPQRTTLMKLSELSTLWDYINRAMPWNQPKTLTVEEVYAVTAYILHLGDIVPIDFVLSDANIADVQKRLPNRDGLKKYAALWDVRGKADVRNVACLANCKSNVVIQSQLPSHARNFHGNLAAQSRLIGATVGIDTEAPSSTQATKNEKVQLVAKAAPDPAPDIAKLSRQNNCNACHAQASKLVGPSYIDIQKKYKDDPAALSKLMSKVRLGGAGVWGVIPMPPHSTISDADLRLLVEWNLRGGK
jgi:S-disulfanyl-L-cysteine oxidoreductase SoxD